MTVLFWACPLSGWKREVWGWWWKESRAQCKSKMWRNLREGLLEETVKTLVEFMTPLTIIQPFVELPGERRHLAGQTSCLDLLEFRDKIVRDLGPETLRHKLTEKVVKLPDMKVCPCPC